MDSNNVARVFQLIVLLAKKKEKNTRETVHDVIFVILFLIQRVNSTNAKPNIAACYFHCFGFRLYVVFKALALRTSTTIRYMLFFRLLLFCSACVSVLCI